MLKGVLVGFGQVAEKAHVPAWSQAAGFSIAAVVEADPQRRALARKLLPGASIHASLEALLAGRARFDFADIATPPFLHGPQAGLALKARLHVLCEKPLTLERAELESLRRESKAAGRVLFCVHNWKHAPLPAKLAELAASGAVGRPRHLEWHVLRTKPAAVAASASNWRTDARLSGGGILVDHGWHAAYLLAWLLGGRPRDVQGLLTPASGSDEEATVLARYPRGTGLAHLSWRSPVRAHRGVLYGTGGAVEVSDDRLVLLRDGAAPQTFVFPEPLSAGSAHPDWFAGTVADFAAALKDRAVAEENAREVEACLDVLETLYGSQKAAARS